ncbi:MAG: hypothetical protein NVS1B6_13610 [Steroidobacteraceae bacterium]
MARCCAAAVTALVVAATPLSSAKAAGSDQLRPAAGVEISASSDSDKTSVVKVLARALWEFDGPNRYQGIDIERAWFAPQGQHARKETRAYLDFADRLGTTWKWSARIGTNGDTVLGSASIRSNDWSKEAFVEREIVETPRGVDEGIYYSFLGASANVLATRRDTISAMAGIQKFTGRNVRLHLRGNLVHVVRSDLGLSIQLRARYFHSTVPGELDYYSPRDFVQLVPVVQMRRFTHGGWMVLVAAGYGAQKATASRWEAARFGELRIESPASSTTLQAFANIQYSNSSLVGAAGNYHYVLGRVGLTSRF